MSQETVSDSWGASNWSLVAASPKPLPHEPRNPCTRTHQKPQSGPAVTQKGAPACWEDLSPPLHPVQVPAEALVLWGSRGSTCFLPLDLFVPLTSGLLWLWPPQQGATSSVVIWESASVFTSVTAQGPHVAFSGVQVVPHVMCLGFPAVSGAP